MIMNHSTKKKYFIFKPANNNNNSSLAFLLLINFHFIDNKNKKEYFLTLTTLSIYRIYSFCT